MKKNMKIEPKELSEKILDNVVAALSVPQDSLKGRYHRRLATVQLDRLYDADRSAFAALREEIEGVSPRNFNALFKTLADNVESLKPESAGTEPAKPPKPVRFRGIRVRVSRDGM